MEYKKNLTNHGVVLSSKKLNGANVHYVLTVKLEFIIVDVLSDVDVKTGVIVEVKHEDALNSWIADWGGYNEIFDMLEEHGSFFHVNSYPAANIKNEIRFPDYSWGFKFHINVPEFYKILIKSFIFTLGVYFEIRIENDAVKYSLKIDKVGSQPDWFYELAVTHERLRWIFYKGDEIATGYKMDEGRSKGRKNSLISKTAHRKTLITSINEWVIENGLEEACRINRSRVAKQIEESTKSLIRENISDDDRMKRTLFPIIKTDGSSLGYEAISKYLAELYPKNNFSS